MGFVFTSQVFSIRWLSQRVDLHSLRIWFITDLLTSLPLGVSSPRRTENSSGFLIKHEQREVPQGIYELRDGLHRFSGSFLIQGGCVLTPRGCVCWTLKCIFLLKGRIRIKEGGACEKDRERLILPKRWATQRVGTRADLLLMALEGEAGHRKLGMFRDAHLAAEPVKGETDGRARVTPVLMGKWVVFRWGGPAVRQPACSFMVAKLALLSHSGQLDLNQEFGQTTKYLNGFPLSRVSFL